MKPRRALICLAEALHEQWLAVESFSAEVYKGHLTSVSQNHFRAVAHDEFRLKLPQEVVPEIFAKYADEHVTRTVNGTGHTGSSRFCATSP